MSRGPLFPLYQAIDARRVDMGLSKKDLEDVSGVTRMTYHRLMDTSKTVTPQIVDALATAVRMPLDAARELAGLRPAPVCRVAAEFDEALASSDLTPSQRTVIADLVAAMRAANEATAGQ